MTHVQHELSSSSNHIPLLLDIEEPQVPRSSLPPFRFETFFWIQEEACTNIIQTKWHQT